METNKTKRWLMALGLVGTLSAMIPGLTGCGGGGGHNDYYQPMWYDVYGNYCGNKPTMGCDYYRDGTKIIDVEDPYYSQYYNLQYAYWEYYDDYGYRQDYLGWAWLSPNNILYDDLGNALNETGGSVDRDLVSKAGEKQKAIIDAVGKEFAGRYSLAENTGIEVANTLHDWAVLAKSRARTQQDIEDFSKKIFKVDYAKVTAALAAARTGNQAPLNDALDEMASHWGTTPETSREILKNAYKDYVTDYNL